MQYRLPASIYNPSQLRQLLSELKRLSDIKNPTSIVFSGGLEELALANKIRKLNLAVVKELHDFVSAILEDSNEITMALACTPSNDERDKLVAELRRMFGKSLLIHFVIQPELLAGATIATKTKLYDLSLKKALFENKNMLVKEIRNG